MKLKHLLTSVFFLIITAFSVHAASTVDFYATESDSTDANMIEMTTDLFFSQFQTIDGFVVVDKRKEHFNKDSAASGISFYAEIQETLDKEWVCTLNVIRLKDNKNVSSTKKYESYYKILLDAKPSLENLLANLSGNSVTPGNTTQVSATETAVTEPSETTVPVADIDQLYGTWTGEAYIEKVLILRGGTGFVIYKNGATMNINVIIEDSDITILQTGRSNASYFPDLPRPAALKNAATAKPIEWKLTLTEAGVLKGQKTTLVSTAKSNSEVEYGTIPVEWKKRN